MLPAIDLHQGPLQRRAFGAYRKDGHRFGEAAQGDIADGDELRRAFVKRLGRHERRDDGDVHR